MLANFFNDTAVENDYIGTVKSEIQAIASHSKRLSQYLSGNEQLQFLPVSYTDVLYTFRNP